MRHDQLLNAYIQHPHLSPDDAWKTLFEASNNDAPSNDALFIPSAVPAHKEMLRLLRESPKDTITIVAIGPLTNLATAAAEDPETFLKVKEVVVMGGAIEIEGNITPVAEFNTYADAVATARIFALTSPNPASTMPPPPANMSSLPSYPLKLSRRLNLTLFPLDITTNHLLTRSTWDAKVVPLAQAGSPLAEWTSVFLGKTFDKIDGLTNGSVDSGLSLHDPLCIWYMLTHASPTWMTAPKDPEDIRVETAGQWTRGMHVVDRRNRRRKGVDPEQIMSPGAAVISNPMDSENMVVGEADESDDVPGDTMGWLSASKGNRIHRMIASPGEEAAAKYVLERIFE